MTDLKVGLVGAGMVAQYHVAGWAACPDARVVAIADPDAQKAQPYAERLNVSSFRSLSAMIDATALDAVDIVAPVQAHEALIAQAVSAGLHVMCQKPLAPTTADAARIVASLPEHARVMVHENWRWRSPYRLLKAALEDGTVSRPTRFEMRVESSGLLPDGGGSYPALVRQPFLAELDRLIVFELLIHHLDTLQFLFGPIAVNAAMLERRCPAVKGEDFAQIELSAGGIPGMLIGDFCRRGRPPKIEDKLFFNDDEAVRLTGWTLNIPGKHPYVIDPQRGYVESYTRTIDHFRSCLQTGARFETPAPDGVRLLEIVDTVYRLASASMN